MKKRMKKRILKRTRGLLLLAWFLAGSLLLPVECPAYESPLDVSRHDYSAGASRKLGRGLANTGLGWVEVFKGMQEVSSESGAWAGMIWGPLYGGGNAIRRTAAGLFETATFPFDFGHDRFQPIVEPEYVLSEGI